MPRLKEKRLPRGHRSEPAATLDPAGPAPAPVYAGTGRMAGAGREGTW